jgi:NitT/TauT family transport system substrate-binding protein
VAALLLVLATLAACATPAHAPAEPAAPPVAGAAVVPTVPGAATSAPAAAATAPPLQHVRVFYTSPVTSQAHLWIGVEAGTFREQGLDVEPMLIAGSDKAIAALLSGEVPAGVLSANTLISATAQGADLVYVAGGLGKLVFQLMVAPGIESVEQLRGQPVGATGRGSQNDFARRHALRRFGFDPERDVIHRSIAGGEPQMLTAMQSGAIAAGAFNAPQDYFAEQAGMRSLARMADWNVPYQGSGVAARRADLTAQRDMLQRLVRGYVAGIARMKADPDFSLAVIRQYLQSDDLPALEWGYRVAVDAIPSQPVPTVEGLQSVIEGLAEVDPDVRKVQPAALIDNSFLDALGPAGSQ